MRGGGASLLISSEVVLEVGFFHRDQSTYVRTGHGGPCFGRWFFFIGDKSNSGK